MEFRFDFDSSRKSWSVKGLGVLFFIGAALYLTHWMSPRLDEKGAKTWIRNHLMAVESARQMKELRESGRSLPEMETALLWQKEFEKIKQMEFVSVDIGSLIFFPPVTSYRVFVVKTVLRFPGQEPQTRYFSLSARGRLFNFFLVAERSRWFWVFSI